MTLRLLVALLAIAFAPAAGWAQERFTSKVIAVTDGDTISVLRDGRAVTVRLEGIDCPEAGQDFGQRAKQFTSDMLFGREASVVVREVDRYRRLVGRVVVGSEDVSVAVVRAGLAWHYTQYSNDAAIAEAEVGARMRKVGVWSRSDSIPPWEFREPVRIVSAESSGPFHGNRQSGVFHRPGCPSYRCSNCTLVFHSHDEAVKAGFRPAGDCLR